MPVVLLSYEYVADILGRRKPHREAHLAHVERTTAEGGLVVAGAVGDPPHGAVFVFEDDADAAGPAAEFAAGDLFAQPWIGEKGRFDVVVACEVLYYLSDVPRTLEAMERLAKVGCLVTYFSPAERKIGAHISARKGVQRDAFRFGETEWTVAWWRP